MCRSRPVHMQPCLMQGGPGSGAARSSGRGHCTAEPWHQGTAAALADGSSGTILLAACCRILPLQKKLAGLGVKCRPASCPVRSAGILCCRLSRRQPAAALLTLHVRHGQWHCVQVYADKASKAMHEIRLENATLRERLQASAAHQAADTAACQQLQDQLAGAQETQLQLEAQLAGRAQQMADVTGQLAEVQVQLEAAHPGREAQQAVQQEVAALREQLTVVQQERHAAAELQHQAAGQAALLRSRSVPACPCCQQALRLDLPALTGSTDWVHSPCWEAGVGHQPRQRPRLPHFTGPGCQQRFQQHCFCCREVEVESLRRMVRELQGMQRGADALRAADEVMLQLITQLASLWHWSLAPHVAGCVASSQHSIAIAMLHGPFIISMRWTCSSSGSLLSAGSQEGA